MEVPQWSPGAEPRWESGGKAPEARYAYTVCSGQTHFRDVHRRYTVYLQAHVESATPPYSKKLFEFVQISRPTLAKVGLARAHPCSTVATPLLLAQQLDIKHIMHNSVPETKCRPDCDCPSFLFLAYLFK